MSRKQLSPRIALWRFGFKQTRKGALILGILIGSMLIIQALGFNAAYPDEKARMEFAASMKSAPALGILYGESDNLVSATGYMAYRVVPVFSLIASIWGLVAATRLFRGQEEDGHWEQVVAGNTTARRASGHILLGYGTSLALAFIVSTLITFAATQSPEINTSLLTCILINVAIFLPIALFAAFGIFVSQLSITRRRALMYGLVPLLGFFVLRAIGNTMEDFYFLKYFTPFGWSEVLNPVIGVRWVWLLPFVTTILVFTAISLYLVGKRDLGAGFIPESESVKPKFFLLGSATKLAIRQNVMTFFAWGIAAVAVSGLIAAISDVAAKSIAESPALEGVVTKFGGSLNDLKVAFLGTGLVFVVTILLLTVTTGMASLRSTEAKNYLDNLLVQPVRRSTWLVHRLLIIIVGAFSVSILSCLTTWLIAENQNISIDLGNFMLVGIALMGTVVFTLGIGTLFYGLLPRVAAISMYTVIGWSFMIDLIGAVFTLDDLVKKTSLFHYVSLSPSAAPDWPIFAWLLALGALFMILGTIAFTKRDIISE